MDRVIRCPRCGQDLPWTGPLKADGWLCISCLKVWHAEQRGQAVAA